MLDVVVVVSRLVLVTERCAHRHRPAAGAHADVLSLMNARYELFAVDELRLVMDFLLSGV
jgi:hypothetical protein